MSDEKALTIDEAIAKMQECAANSDIELAHIEADEILCDFLCTLGYGALVDEFEAVGKWYALKREGS